MLDLIGWLGKIILKPLLNDLQKFGDFKWLNIKRNFMKVCFKEPDIANTVIKNESLRQNYDLNFSIQRIKGKSIFFFILNR